MFFIHKLLYVSQFLEGEFFQIDDDEWQAKKKKGREKEGVCWVQKKVKFFFLIYELRKRDSNLTPSN